MPEHPIVKQAANLPPDIRAMAARQAREWDGTVQAIEALSPGHPGGEAVLHHAADLLASLTVNYGPIGSWTLARRHFIYRHARRLFGPDQLLFNRPGWSEA